jgi:two-component system invasion response regulator UvrY
MKSFLLIDDHEIVRAGLKSVLHDLFKPCVVAEAWDETTSLEQLKKRAYTLIFMDVQVPGTNATALMEYININYPAAKVLIFSMADENIYAKRFLKAGAVGFLSKTCTVAELKKAIELILKNRRYISQNLVDILAEQIVPNHAGNPFEKLSQREFDIAAALLKGSSISEISALLNISISTVGTYKGRVFEKLRIKNIVELIELGRMYQIK